MTTQEQIQQQLNDEYAIFINKKYDGNGKPPENLIEIFKKAIKAMPPFSHKLNFNKVKIIANSNVKDLDNGMMNDIIKTILNAPLEKLYEGDFNEIVDKQIKVEHFTISYNQHIDEFQKRLSMKKATLESLSVKPTNNMRIIPHGQA